MSEQSGFVQLGGKIVKKEHVKSKVKGAEKHLSGLKKKRGGIQTSPPSTSKEEKQPHVSTGAKSPSYLRRLERRRLIREVAALTEQAELSKKSEPVVSEPLTSPFPLLQSGGEFATNLVLPLRGKILEFTSPTLGLVRFSRAKVTSVKVALDLLPPGAPAVRLGILKKVSSGWSLSINAVPSLGAAFLLGALHTSPETLPGDFVFTSGRD